MDDTFASRSDNIFYHLFTAYDQWHLLLFVAICGLFSFWRGKGFKSVRFTQIPGVRVLMFAATAVIMLCALGTHFIFMNYPFAMDEYYSDFQAEIFAQGKVFATIPPDLAPLAKAASPPMINFNAIGLTWTSNYLPVYALLRTPFWIAGCAWLLNPLQAGLTLFATAGVVRRIWPTQPELAWVGVILMACNIQFLITGMTAYAMSAHLLANLLWLWLYLDPSPKKQLLAPLLGVLAVGLHQPNVHLVFAFPFCLKLLFDKRWKMAAYHALIYGFGIWLWMQFIDYKSPPTLLTDAKPPASTLDFIITTFFTKLPNITQILDLAIGWAKIFAWTPFATLFLAAALFSQWRKINAHQVCLIAGIVIATATSLLFPINQGHGWGNRYFFPYLGNLTLLAVAGFQGLTDKKASSGIVLASGLVSLFLVFPLQAWECHREVRPFAMSSQKIRSLAQQVVVIDTKSIWYGQDLIRNRPGLANTPKLVFMSRYTDEVAAYCKLHPPAGRVQISHLQRLGIKPRMVPPPPASPSTP